MLKKNLLKYILIVLIVFSCAHHKSGKYVFQKGRWVFVKKKTGFLQNGIDFGRVDNSHYNFSDDSRFIWPVPSSKKVSSQFGVRRGKHHDGIDIPAVTGTHVIASADGKVMFSGRMSGYGRVVIVRHDDGYHTVYAHNSRNLVKKGESVDQGEVIARVGSSGRSSGPHLHFEIRRKNKVRNPAFYLARLKK